MLCFIAVFIKLSLQNKDLSLYHTPLQVLPGCHAFKVDNQTIYKGKEKKGRKQATDGGVYGNGCVLYMQLDEGRPPLNFLRATYPPKTLGCNIK